MSEAKERQTGYKELQNLFKEIAQKSALDKEYRQLCLRDSQAAIRQFAGQSMEIPDGIIFLEEDGDCLEQNTLVFVLPPFIKKSWILGQEKE